MIAGFNYFAWRKPPDGTNFSIFAKRRADRLIAQAPDLTVWLFDVGAGQLLVNVSAKKRSWTPVGKFEPPTRAANYTGHTFDRNPKDVMSITDVYEKVVEIGRKDPGTLVELSFFSHGYYGGPILVNSNDRKQSGGLRDPDDKDARIFKDFNRANLPKERRTLLRNAFRNGARVWAWGCVFTEMYFEVFLALSKSPTYRKVGPGKLDDADTFELSFSAEQAKRFYALDLSFFPAPTTAGKPVLSFRRTWAQIRDYYERALKDVYVQNFASVAKVKGYGAVPGTWAGLEPGDKGLMLVPKKQITSPKGERFDGFGRYLELFHNHLNVAEDPESRGYGTYVPRKTWRAVE